jgi:nucleoside-diphosphate-sugar epimerase
VKILITGATGFIGKRLLERLLAKGHDVVCLVRKTSKIDFLKNRETPLITCDITDAGQVERAFGQARPEYVFHCAASVESKDEEELYKTNGIGTRNICSACYKYGVERLIYVSSVAVISGNPRVPLVDALPYKATNGYGRSKIEAERVVMDFRSKGLCTAVIRPCMVYGEDEPHLLGRILGEVASRHIPVLDFPGMDSRLQLASVDNVVQALELALQKEEALQGTFIITDSETITIRKFLEILYDASGAGRPPVVPDWAIKLGLFIPFFRRKADRYFKDRVYDISRARDVLGYDPKVSTEEGLRKTVKHWKSCQK